MQPRQNATGVDTELASESPEPELASESPEPE